MLTASKNMTVSSKLECWARSYFLVKSAPIASCVIPETAWSSHHQAGQGVPCVSMLNRCWRRPQVLFTQAAVPPSKPRVVQHDRAQPVAAFREPPTGLLSTAPVPVSVGNALTHCRIRSSADSVVNDHHVCLAVPSLILLTGRRSSS
jgi:hypothetical protein